MTSHTPNPGYTTRDYDCRSPLQRHPQGRCYRDTEEGREGATAGEPHLQDPQSSNNLLDDIEVSLNDNHLLLPPSFKHTSSSWTSLSPTLTTFLNNQFRRRWNNIRKKNPSLFFAVPKTQLVHCSTRRMILLLSLAFIGGLVYYIYYMWKAEAVINSPWTPDPSSRLFAQRPLPRPIESSFLAPAADVNHDGGDEKGRDQDGTNEEEQDEQHNGRKSSSNSSTYYTLPLRTQGRNIVDQNGRRFKLSSVNWYGASDELFIPGGLDVQHRTTIAATIRALGFNSVRLPYSDEMVMSDPPILPHLVSANPDLIGLRAMDVFEKCVEALTDAGIAVIVNNHITSATWCCGADPCDAGWANDHLGPLCRVKQTEDEWIEHWEAVMGRFVGNPLVIGADLRNEVRGVWGTMTWDRWAGAAERAGNRLLGLNRDWLIVVGGTESGNDLTGVRRRPVRLDVDGRVVYSAHVYSWSGWGSMEGRYAKRSYPSFVKAMRTNWAYLVEGDEAPVWIGEFGAPNTPSTGDANYWANLLRYLKSIDADFGYWAINPRKPKDDERESYSLVADDWVTPLLDYRMKDMTELMRIPYGGGDGEFGSL